MTTERKPYIYRTLSWKCVCGTELGAPQEHHNRLIFKDGRGACEVTVGWKCTECKAATYNGPFLEIPCPECDEKEEK